MHNEYKTVRYILIFMHVLSEYPLNCGHACMVAGITSRHCRAHMNPSSPVWRLGYQFWSTKLSPNKEILKLSRSSEIFIFRQFVRNLLRIRTFAKTCRLFAGKAHPTERVKRAWSQVSVKHATEKTSVMIWFTGRAVARPIMGGGGGGGGIFIYLCFARRISFESDCFYGMWTWIYEYTPPPPLSHLRPCLPGFRYKLILQYTYRFNDGHARAVHNVHF